MSEAKEIRVLLADDHNLVRAGVRKILEAQPGVAVVGEVADGAAALDALARTPVDVLVLDLSMPGLDGFAVLRRARALVPALKVLVLSMHADSEFVSRAVREGADGYLLKDSAGKDLIRAIASVAEGQSFFSPAVSRMMLDDYVRRAAGNDAADRYDTLSNREREIFQLVAEGRSNKEVAELLSISAATVETHRARVLQKLNVHNTAELVLYAVRRGVIS